MLVTSKNPVTAARTKIAQAAYLSEVAEVHEPTKTRTEHTDIVNTIEVTEKTEVRGLPEQQKGHRLPK